MKFDIERERRFLVKRMPRRFVENCGKEITQWYICLDPPVRVRIEDFDDCSLTVKIDKDPDLGERYELEDDIPKDAILALAKAKKGDKIRKTRYQIGNLELNVFCGILGGLVLLEFEIKSEEDVFLMPFGFLAEEVTGDERFEGHNLAQLDCIPDDWKCEII